MCPRNRDCIPNRVSEMRIIWEFTNSGRGTRERNIISKNFKNNKVEVVNTSMLLKKKSQGKTKTAAETRQVSNELFWVRFDRC